MPSETAARLDLDPSLVQAITDASILFPLDDKLIPLGKQRSALLAAVEHVYPEWIAALWQIRDALKHLGVIHLVPPMSASTKALLAVVSCALGELPDLSAARWSNIALKTILAKSAAIADVVGRPDSCTLPSPWHTDGCTWPSTNRFTVLAQVEQSPRGGATEFLSRSTVERLCSSVSKLPNRS
jgi:hypothetical protein